MYEMTNSCSGVGDGGLGISMSIPHTLLTLEGEDSALTFHNGIDTITAQKPHNPTFCTHDARALFRHLTFPRVDAI